MLLETINQANVLTTTVKTKTAKVNKPKKERKPSTFQAIKETNNRQKEEQRSLSGAIKWLMNDKKFIEDLKQRDELFYIRITSNSLIDLINICKSNFTEKEAQRVQFTSFTVAQILRRDIKA